MSEIAGKIKELILSDGDKGDALMQVVGLLTNISKEEVSEVLKEVVESFIADFRPIVLGILEAASEVIPNNVLIPLVNLFKESFLVCLEDKDSIALSSKLDKVKASIVAKKINVYEKAGLSREEAVMFVKQEMANIKAFVSDVDDRMRSINALKK